jgi:hypothetical protein
MAALFTSRTVVMALTPVRWRVLSSLTLTCSFATSELTHNVLVSRSANNLKHKDWRGAICKIGPKSKASLIPLVTRTTAVEQMANKLIHNLVVAERIRYCGSHLYSIQFVGSGALSGSGKSSIGPVVKDFVQHLLDTRANHKNRTVVYCRVTEYTNIHSMWLRICEEPMLMGLRKSIIPSMIFLEMLRVTEKYLKEHGLIMFLHLDDFVPFDELGPKTNTAKEFERCRTHMLLGILSTPGVCLYTSGRMPYFDSAGVSMGYKLHQFAPPILDLFRTVAIHDILKRVFVPDPAAPNSQPPQQLAHLLDELVPLKSTPPTQQMLASAVRSHSDRGGAHATGVSADKDLPTEVASEEVVFKDDRGKSGSWLTAHLLYEVTGGVPGFVESALRGMLDHPVVATLLFEGAALPLDRDTLRSMFQQGGTVFNAVLSQAKRHFTAAAKDQPVDTTGQPAGHVAGLLRVMFHALQHHSIPLSPNHLRNLQTARVVSSSYHPEGTLLQQADYWGVHRDVNASAQTLRFALSPAAFLALQSTRGQVPGFASLQEYLGNPSGGDAGRLAIELALVLNAHTTGVLPGVAVPWECPTSTTTAKTTRGSPCDKWPRPFKLPVLPVIHRDGKPVHVRDVEKFTFGHAEKSTGIVQMKPFMLGALLDERYYQYDVFKSGPDSACADYFLCAAWDLHHIQVIDAPELQWAQVVEALRNAAAVALGALRANHTLALVITQPAARASSLEQFGALSAEQLAEKVAAFKPGLRSALNRAKELLTAAKEAALSETGKRPRLPALVSAVRQATREKYYNDAACRMLKSGRMKLLILNDEQYGTLFQYNELTRRICGV